MRRPDIIHARAQVQQYICVQKCDDPFLWYKYMSLQFLWLVLRFSSYFHSDICHS